MDGLSATMALALPVLLSWSLFKVTPHPEGRNLRITTRFAAGFQDSDSQSSRLQITQNMIIHYSCQLDQNCADKKKEAASSFCPFVHVECLLGAKVSSRGRWRCGTSIAWSRDHCLPKAGFEAGSPALES